MKTRRRSRFYYTYEDLSELTGFSIANLKKKRGRGEFIMENFVSVANFIVACRLLQMNKVQNGKVKCVKS